MINRNTGTRKSPAGIAHARHRIPVLWERVGIDPGAIGDLHTPPGPGLRPGQPRYDPVSVRRRLDGYPPRHPGTRTFNLIKSLTETDWKLLVAYLCCAAVIGVAFALDFTPMSGLDEEYHFKRALQVEQGELFGRHLGPNQYGGRLDRRIVALEHWFDVVRNDGKPTRIVEAQAAEAAALALPRGRDMHWFPSTASYPPLPYLPAAAGLLASRMLHLGLLTTMLVGRLASLTTFVALVGLVAVVLPVGRLCVLACLTTPTSLSLAGSFSADPVSLALPLLFAACCLRLTVAPDVRMGKGWASGLMLLAISLGLLKLTCCLVALLVLLIPSGCFRSTLHGWTYRVVLITTCFGMTLLWNAEYPFVPGQVWGVDADPAETIRVMRAAPLQALLTMRDALVSGAHWWWTDAFSRFGGGPVPYFFKFTGILPSFGFAMLIVLLLLDRDRRPSPRVGALLGLVAFAYVGLVLMAFRIGFSSPHDRIIGGLQGRYFLLPLGLMLLAAASLLPDRHIPFLRTVLAGRLAAAAVLCINGLVALAAIRRYAVLWY